jgi:hypothetical protein
VIIVSSTIILYCDFSLIGFLLTSAKVRKLMVNILNYDIESGFQNAKLKTKLQSSRHSSSKRKTNSKSVGKPRTDSVPPTMQSQIPKSRDVTLFFFGHDALQVSGHALFTSTPHVFLLNIFINKTERSIHFY